MAGKEVTNRQLLDAINTRFDGLETRFDKLEEMLSGVKSVIVGIANDMATSEELTEFKRELREDLDDVELRLGRRIDVALAAKPTR